METEASDTLLSFSCSDASTFCVVLFADVAAFNCVSSGTCFSVVFVSEFSAVVAGLSEITVDAALVATLLVVLFVALFCN
ncbi:hypothetical protein [Companilactobacillus bobalius]|uniref:hypothetical protein n=1 Tax=Companilactobacillus bobalius TaxID=2801451 RepID=UPI001F195C8D|nr:hypothetical protein [Companilactobacillus bobalius]